MRPAPTVPCAHCPVGESCPAIQRRHGRYCETQDPAEQDYRADLAADMAAMLKGDPHPHYARTGSGPPTIEKPSPAPRWMDITIRSYLTPWIGYGQLGEWLGRGLESRGHRVGFVDLATDSRYLKRDPWVSERVIGKGWDDDSSPLDWSLMAAVPFTPHPGGRLVRYTQWESSFIGKEAVDQCNRSDLLLLPGSWQVETFRNSGVKVPVEIVHQGIDPKVYHDDGSPIPSDVFRVGLAGRLHHGGCRKGINEGITAFLDAFPGRKDVELVIKCFEDDVELIEAIDDPRIKILTTPLSHEGMANWYRSLNLLLVPSKGEGWGLQTQQAMAVGRPVAAIPWSGTTEFWDERYGWNLEYDLMPATASYEDRGLWAVPRHDSMVSILRHAESHRDECVSKGKVAATRASQFTWDRTAGELETALIRHGFLSKEPSLWSKIVSLGKAVSEHVAAGMPTVSDEEKAARLEICRACPKYNADGGTCRVCGCAMALKASWGLSVCPEGKWTSQAT